MYTATDTVKVIDELELGRNLDLFGDGATDGLWFIDRFWQPNERQPLIRLRNLRTWSRQIDDGFGIPYDNQFEYENWINAHSGATPRYRLWVLRELHPCSFIYVAVDTHNPLAEWINQ